MYEVQVQVVLRLWLRGEAVLGVHPKTVRRCFDAALAAGVLRDGGEASCATS